MKKYYMCLLFFLAITGNIARAEVRQPGSSDSPRHRLVWQRNTGRFIFDTRLAKAMEMNPLIPHKFPGSQSLWRASGYQNFNPGVNFNPLVLTRITHNMPVGHTYPAFGDINNANERFRTIDWQLPVNQPWPDGRFFEATFEFIGEYTPLYIRGIATPSNWASYISGLVKPGVKITLRMEQIGTRHYAFMYVDDVLVHTEGADGSKTMSITIAEGGGIHQYYDPVITQCDPVVAVVGDVADWTVGVQAHWGLTTELLIPDHGIVENMSLNATGTDPILSTDGIIYDKIGVVLHHIRVKDSHALFPEVTTDYTSASDTRLVTVTTVETPTLTVTYGSSATNKYGTPIPTSTTYDSLLTSITTSTEEGWTNQPLDITVDPASILGTFDTVLQLPMLPAQIALSAPTTFTNYATQSPSIAGTSITGVLTEVGNLGNELSGIVLDVVKIDHDAPVASATHDGFFGFTDTSVDSLSGISVVNYPTQIAFAPPSESAVAPTSGWEDIDTHTMNTTGNYDVWVRATDKAGNETTTKVFANLFVGGDVVITKDSDEGAVLHVWDCTNYGGMVVESDCETDCGIGASPELEELTAFTYELTLTNRALSDDAVGTFEDYLPEGVTVMSTPTIATSGSATLSVASDLILMGPYAGRYHITGTYHALAPGEIITVSIPVETPAFDDTPGESNIISNQAETDYTIGTGMTQIIGSNLSNFANHRVRTQGVKTVFTKVGADDIDTGLSGAEYALYRWDGAVVPTSAEQNHMVDPTVLVDSTLPGGNWVRVKENGDIATSLADIFVSAASPLGEVNIGSLLDGYYTLIETKAPTGYELPIGQWILTIDQSKSDTIGDYKIEFAGKSQSIMPPAAVRETSGGVHTYKIINAKPFTIGMSGLEGTKGLLLVGFVLMALAGNAYVVSSYKQRKKK